MTHREELEVAVGAISLTSRVTNISFSVTVSASDLQITSLESWMYDGISGINGFRKKSSYLDSKYVGYFPYTDFLIVCLESDF